jgi:hypothetical protein
MWRRKHPVQSHGIALLQQAVTIEIMYRRIARKLIDGSRSAEARGFISIVTVAERDS